jgi:type IV pilus assembly protein PilE
MRKQKCSWKYKHGFTVIELMIAIAILGILVVVGLPAYQQHLRKSRRADARITLENLAAAQELYYFHYHRYAEKFSEIRMVEESVLNLPSEYGLYAITLAGDDFSWSLSATPTGPQAEDVQCAVFSLTHLGDHTALDSEGLPSSCW